MKPTPSREEIVAQAAAQLPIAERAMFLDGACRGNPALRERVEVLLSSLEQAGRPSAVDAEALRTTSISNSVAQTEDEAVCVTLGRYRLLEKLGEGGCGVVYVAEQTEPVRRRVALKVIKAGMDTKQVVARFEAERQALAMMDHPNIAKVLDGGATQAGRPYFVMELVRGVRITDYCDQNNLGTRERLDLFIKVCQAIQHAHQKGIIHRDIKPSNILVTLHDGTAVPKVIDFGIAKATGGRLNDATVYTQLHQFMGTPAYMSPEQAEMNPDRSGDIDTRSDIYSLGVLLYELLAGRTPFDARELVASGIEAMRRVIRDQEPVRPSTRVAMLHPDELTATAKRRSSDAPKLVHLLQGDLDWIVMKCLEKDRTRRYETANGVAADLRRHLGNEPVIARPPSTAYYFQKAWRRNKLAFMAGTGIAAALIAGIAASTWQAIVATRARAAEKEQRVVAQAAQKQAERAEEGEKRQRVRADAEKAIAQRLLYVANMNLAQQAWEQNNIARLRQLLDETQDSTNRGFEWYYWQRQTHLALKTLSGHLQAVSAVDVSRDGGRILTGSKDGTVKVWNMATGAELLSFRAHTSEISSVSFSPDGNRIVTGSYDRTVRVWEAATGRELQALQGHIALMSHVEPVFAVAFSPDGGRIVSGSGDHLAKVWDSLSGRELITLKGHGDQVKAIAFSPDGQQIVTGSADATARIWDAITGRELFSLPGHGGGVMSVAFSPDGKRVLTAGVDATTRVWETATGLIQVLHKGHGTGLTSLAFSPDGARILSGGLDQAARVSGTETGSDLLTLKGHSGSITCVAFSPEGDRIITGSEDATVKVWDAAIGRHPLVLKGHSNAITSVAFSSDGRRIVTGSDDSTAKVWETANGRELLALEGHTNWILAAAFSPSGQRIITGGWDKVGRVWDAASGRELLQLRGHTGLISSIAFSPDGGRILTGSADGTARLWEATNGRQLLLLGGHSAGPVRGIESVGFSPDGRLITGGDDGMARVWEEATGREVMTLRGHTNWVMSVAFSADGKRVVTGGLDQTARVWDAGSGQELITLKGHSDRVSSVAFSSDGQRVITGSADGTARLWEVESGRELLILKGQTFRSVAISPDNLRIVGGGWERLAMVWEAASASQVAAWKEEEGAAMQSLATARRSRSAVVESGVNARGPDFVDVSSQASEPVKTEAMLREGLRLARLTETNQPARVADKMLALARQLSKADQRAEHEALMDEALSLLAQSPAQQGAAYSLIVNEEVRTREQWRDFDGALRLCRQSCELFRRMPGDQRSGIANALIHSTTSLARLNRWEEDEKVSREIVQLRIDQFGPDASLTLNAKMALGVVLEARGEPGAAEAAYREAASGFVHCPDFEPGMADNAAQTFAFFLVQKERHAEAEKVLLEGWNALQSHSNTTVEQRHDAAKRIVELYQAWDAIVPNAGRAAQAAEWKKRLAEFSPSPSPN